MDATIVQEHPISKIKVHDVLLIGIICIGIIVRFLFPEQSLGSFDEVSYHVTATNIVKGEGAMMQLETTMLPTIYPVGLPLLLAGAYRVFGCKEGVGILFITLISIISLWVFYKVSKQNFSIDSNWLATMFIAWSVPHLILSTMLLSDVPAFLFFLLTLVTISSERCGIMKYPIAGFMAGISFLIRPANIILFALPLIINILQKKTITRNIKNNLLFFLGCLPCALLFIIENNILYGKYITTGYAWYKANNILTFAHINVSVLFPNLSGTGLRQRMGSLLFNVYQLADGTNLIGKFDAGSTAVTFSPFIFIFGILGMGKAVVKKNPFKIALVLICGLNILFHAFVSPFVPRYLLSSYAILIYFAAEELSKTVLSGSGYKKLRGITLVATACLIVIPGAINAGEQLHKWHSASQDIVTVSKWIKDDTEKDAIIITNSPLHVNYYGCRKAILIRDSIEEDVKKTERRYRENMYIAEPKASAFKIDGFTGDVVHEVGEYSIVRVRKQTL